MNILFQILINKTLIHSWNYTKIMDFLILINIINIRILINIINVKGVYVRNLKLKFIQEYSFSQKLRTMYLTFLHKFLKCKSITMYRLI